ncbi:MAG: M15 family peptidase [Pseudomonadota bacterium]
MSALLALQFQFPRLVAALITQAAAMGYDCTLGEAWRTPEQAAIYAAEGKGIAHSEHCNKLAIDLSLFKYGVYLTDTAAYAALGAWWKLQHPAARWGGDFARADGNHFSLEFEGIS